MIKAGPTLLLAAAVALALAGCETSEPVSISPDEYSRQLFDGVNEQRADAGLSQLTWSDCLAEEAGPRAEKAATEVTLEHEPLASTCMPKTAAGENLSRGDFSPDEIVAKWMNSAGHKANILRPGFEIAGAACVPLPNAAPGLACSLLFEGGD